MDFIGSIGDDFKYRFMRNISALDIMFIIILAGMLAVALLSEKIAKRFKKTDREILRLSVKIKTVALILTAILAMVITQFF